MTQIHRDIHARYKDVPHDKRFANRFFVVTQEKHTLSINIVIIIYLEIIDYFVFLLGIVSPVFCVKL